MPQPPYVLLFDEVKPDAVPVVISVDDRPAVPLFGSRDRARAFLNSTGFGEDLEPVEVSANGLIRALGSCRDHAGYVALDPPPAGEGEMRVRMGGLTELIEALTESQESENPFGWLGTDSS